jgi:hypothetical protein
MYLHNQVYRLIANCQLYDLNWTEWNLLRLSDLQLVYPVFRLLQKHGSIFA